MYVRIGLVFACLFAVLATPAGAAVNSSQSGWYWGNPLPQGNSLSAVGFSSNVGYAVGGFGTLVRTVDGGVTWTGIRTGTTLDLNGVEVIDADSLIIANPCELRRSDNSGESWTRLPFTRSGRRCSRLTDLSFPEANVGFLLLENGDVLRSGDGGRSFSKRTPVPGTPEGGGPSVPTAVAFVSRDLGYATTSGGQLYRTTDAGTTWSQEFVSGGVLNDLFVSGNSGVVVGANGMFAVTGDSGDTWTRTVIDQTYAVPLDLVGVSCSAGACLMPARGGQLVRTTDGGRTFQILGIGASAAAFASATRAVAVGGSGATHISDNAGGSFTRIGGSLNVNSFGRVRASTASVAHAAGNRGALARTTDGGQTWDSQDVPTSEDIIDVSFPSTEVGYALDSTGGLFRTDNGGNEWEVRDSGTSTEPNALIAPDATIVLLVGPSGLLRTTDGGQSFSQVRDGDVRRRTLDDADRAGRSTIVWGPRVIAVSGNRGRTWRKIKRPSSREVRSVDFLSGRAGYVLEDGGRIFFTRNGGRKWTESLSVGSHAGMQLVFGDSANGWLSIDGFSQEGAHVLRTSDGGRSWRPQLLGPGDLGSIAAGGRGAAFAHKIGGGESQRTQLMATGTGGDAGATSRLRISTPNRRITKARRIEIRGTLSPARGGEEIVVSFRSAKGGRWGHEIVTAATNGRFTLERRVSSSTLFVAQWRGDEEGSPAGSAALRVTRTKRGK